MHLAPDKAEYAVFMGALLHETGNWDDAATTLEQVLGPAALAAAKGGAAGGHGGNGGGGSGSGSSSNSGGGGGGSSLMEKNMWKNKRRKYVDNLCTDVFGREKFGVGKAVGTYQLEFSRKHKTKLMKLLNKAVDSSNDLIKLKNLLREDMGKDDCDEHGSLRAVARGAEPKGAKSEVAFVSCCNAAFPFFAEGARWVKDAAEGMSEGSVLPTTPGSRANLRMSLLLLKW